MSQQRNVLPSLQECLEDHTVDALKNILSHFDLSKKKPTRKADLVALLSEVLQTPKELKRL